MCRRGGAGVLRRSWCDISGGGSGGDGGGRNGGGGGGTRAIQTIGGGEWLDIGMRKRVELLRGSSPTGDVAAVDVVCDNIVAAEAHGYYYNTIVA